MAAGALTGCSSGSHAGPAQGFDSALKSTARLSAYSFQVTVQAGSTDVVVAGRFHAPDQIDEVQSVGGKQTEVVEVGTKAASRSLPSGAWAALSTGSISDPRATFDALLKATGVTVSGTTYSFTLSGAPAAQLVNGATTLSGTATVAGGQITSLTYSTSAPTAIKVAALYTPATTSSAITLPS